MISDKFVILGALFNLFGEWSYAVDTFKGKTRPNLVSWLLWTLVPLLAFAAEINEGVGLRSLTTFMASFGPLLVLAAVLINRKSVWRLTKFDFVCGALSMLGLVLWLLTRHGDIAIAFSIIADGMAALPTVRKAYSHPRTETYITYFAAAVSAALNLLSIDNWNFANYGFPVYLLVICLLLTVLIKFRVGLRLQKVFA